MSLNKIILGSLIACFYIFQINNATAQTNVNTALSTIGLEGANKLFDRLEPKHLTDNISTCFDKKILYFGTINNEEPINGCFYINSIDGYVAQVTNRENRLCGDMENITKGTIVVIYSTFQEAIKFEIDRKGKKTFRKITDNNIYIGNSTMRKGNATPVQYSSFRVPTYNYHKSGGSTNQSWYLFARSYPATFSITKHLGMFGLGYYLTNTNKAMFCMALKEPNKINIEVLEIQDVMACFDGEGYISEVAENIEANEEINEKATQKINNKERDIANNPTCADAKTALLEHQKRMLDKSKRATDLYRNTNGNFNARNQSQMQTLNNAGDTKDKLIEEKLKTEVDICYLEDNIATAHSRNMSARAVNLYQVKKQCLEEKVAAMQTTIHSMTQIETQFANNIGKQLQEKNMLYLQFHSLPVNNCNFDKDGNKKELHLEEGTQQLRTIIQNEMRR